MITYEAIAKANETIKTTDIKGKPYAEVFQRVNAFRMVYPEGTIFTEIVSNEDGIVVIKATVSDGERVLATGTAFEKADSSFINKTSHIENCETSAVGRALGMAGFGIETSMSSFEEVSNAIIGQERMEHIDWIGKACYKDGTQNDEAVEYDQTFLDRHGYKKLKELSRDHAIVLEYLMEEAFFAKTNEG